MASQELIQQVWQKGGIVRGEDPKLYRRDLYGNLIYRHSYGKITPMGWEIDHIFPVSKGGSHRLSNLQPTHWRTNRRKSDRFPYQPD